MMNQIIEALNYIWLKCEVVLYKIFADDGRRYEKDYLHALDVKEM